MLSPETRTSSWLDRHNAAIVHLASLPVGIVETLKTKVLMLLGDAAKFSIGLDGFDISLTTGAFQIPTMAIDDGDSDDKIHAIVAGHIETFMKGFNRGAIAGERARGDGRDGQFVEPVTIKMPDSVVPFRLTATPEQVAKIHLAVSNDPTPAVTPAIKADVATMRQAVRTSRQVVGVSRTVTMAEVRECLSSAFEAGRTVTAGLSDEEAGKLKPQILGWCMPKGTGPAPAA